jgi:hypothetical protein
MLLYRCHPISQNQNAIVNLNRKEELFKAVSEALPKYKGKTLHPNDHIGLVTDASVLSGLLTLSGYKNVLVVTSFADKDYDTVVKGHQAHKSAGDHLVPIVHKAAGTMMNMYVTKVKSGDWFTPFYESYGVKTLDVDSPFALDSTFKIKPPADVKFDAVVLLGCDAYSKGKFNVKDIKETFTRYCTPEFDLIDVYRHENDTRSIVGSTPKQNTVIAQTMFQAVNTPKKLIDKTNGAFVNRELEMPNMRSVILYSRLASNIINVDKWYKVY